MKSLFQAIFLALLCVVSEDIYESYSRKYHIGGVFMDKTYLPDLISGLEQELLRLGYTKGSMTFYRRRWNQLMAYAEDRGECYYTEQLGMDFLKEFFGITQEDFSRTLPQAETQEIRVVRNGWGFPAPPCGASALSQA